MITVNGHVLKPTIFPDKTSQVWKLPDKIIWTDDLQVDWRFQDEREIFDLLALRKLNDKADLTLYIPYLPFARQDKEVSNDSTFNLHVMADLINMLDARHVESFDVHSSMARKLIKRFSNIKPIGYHQRLRADIGADVIVYPDAGAFHRYELWHPNTIVMEKNREQATGKIVGHKVVAEYGEVSPYHHYLILDDLVDGGATFISIANHLKCRSKKISLFTSHGIYSKGTQVLRDAGISGIYTTNSYIRSRHSYEYALDKEEKV